MKNKARSCPTTSATGLPGLLEILALHCGVDFDNRLPQMVEARISSTGAGHDNDEQKGFQICVHDRLSYAGRLNDYSFSGLNTIMKTVITESVASKDKWAGKLAVMGPVLLSAIIYPGLGQMVQRRWIAGSVYAILYTIVFGWLMIRSFGILKIYYELAFDFNNAAGQVPKLSAIAWPFLFSILVYLASLIDTALGNRPPKLHDQR